MLLLSGHSLKAARKVPLEAMSLQLNERESTATITPESMTGITIDSWFQDETEPGKGIVWRVKNIRTAYAKKTTTIQLEHAISTLKDKILFGEIKPEKMAGKKNAKTCTAEQAIRYVLAQQSDWALGTMAFSVSNPYKFDGDTLFDALETISNSLEDCWWTYDFSTYPFKLNFTKKSSAIGTVMRAGRNLTTITKTIDKAGMFTRHYPIGKNDLHISGKGYVEKNTQYGIIEKVETDQTIDTEAELKRWSNERLERHAEPAVTIDVEGMELAEQTGEPLDRIVLGRKCWAPLNEFNTEILETITALNYPDKLFRPKVFRATMANTKRDITKIISDAIKSGGRGGRASARRAQEDNAWFEDTTEHVAMCAKGIVGTDKNGNPDWTRLSRIYVDGNGIEQTVSTTKDGLKNAESRISQTETSISQVVTAVGKDGKVTAASIALAINNGGSTATIKADQIKMGDGKTALSAVMTITNGAVFISKPMSAKNITLTNGSAIKFAGNGVTLTESASADLVRNLRITQDGNTYYLQKIVLGDAQWTTVGSFSRAVASWDESWSGGNFRVKAQPQNQEAWTAIAKGTESWSGRTVTIPIVAYNSNAPGTQVSTGYSVSATYTASKSDISMTRSRKTSEPSTDASLTWISSNGWYQFDVTACGVTKTYKIQVDVSE